MLTIAAIVLMWALRVFLGLMCLGILLAIFGMTFGNAYDMWKGRHRRQYRREQKKIDLEFHNIIEEGYRHDAVR